MAKVGGNEVHVKYVRTHQFYEIRVHIFLKLGERKISRKRGKFESCCELLKRRSTEMLANENRNFFWEKVKLGKKFSEIGGNLKQRGKCIIALGGMNAPAHICAYQIHVS